MRAHIPYEQGRDGVNLRIIQIDDLQIYSGKCTSDSLAMACSKDIHILNSVCYELRSGSIHRCIILTLKLINKLT